VDKLIRGIISQLQYVCKNMQKYAKYADAYICKNIFHAFQGTNVIKTEAILEMVSMSIIILLNVYNFFYESFREIIYPGEVSKSDCKNFLTTSKSNCIDMFLE